MFSRRLNSYSRLIARRIIRQYATLSAMLALLAGCLSPDPRRPVTTNHPANPNAEEAPFDEPPNLLVQPLSPHPKKPSAQGEAITYTCPMHPDVRKASPGTCPICGMTLEVLNTAANQSHDQSHEGKGDQ